MKILVTGGAGYIGSFIVRELKNDGFIPLVVDNLSTGHKEAVKDFRLEIIDLVSQSEKLEALFQKEDFTGVIHMAASIEMEESCLNPAKYYRNNVVGSLNLLELMVKHKVPNLIFSSTAGVYGEPKRLPIKEDAPLNPANPYGETKLMTEKMLSWFDEVYGLRSMSLRYFNAAGAALDGSVGLDNPKPSHIIPNALMAAINGKEFRLFGDDYATPDGTCIRDYIHVLDLASAHILALKALVNGAKSNVYNLGTGRGNSNKEVIAMAEKVAGIKAKVKIMSRRAGDVPKLVASNAKIGKDLGWKPKYGLEEIIETAYLWYKNHPQGYKKS